ncbi:tRNA(His) guanylyltransferase Thg1 family protein [Streptomyces sp. C10-9-1]|uniref:tRNA(His) guanylyltransferase Thg1 family protein n=1 Tax=Streptomyces sp. C10-9-1 TaxID=1859285 RepID=UPI003F4A636A
MSDTIALGDRMKAHEAAYRVVLPRRTYSIIRVDIRAARTYLRGARRPYDQRFMDDMDAAATALCDEISGAACAYVQSDEISILATDFARAATQPWFGGVVAKQLSISAAVATAVLMERRPGRRVAFDSRVFTLADPVEVANYFIWRQRDAVRNSIAMAAQAHFSHRRLRGVSTDEMRELLLQEKGIDWSSYPSGFRRGRVVYRKAGEQDITYTDRRTDETVTTRAVRSWWAAEGAPRFTAEPGTWLSRAIPAQPTLTGARS